MKTIFDRLTLRQREVLGEIAVNQDGGHHPRVLKSLEKLGLIESYGELLPGHPPCTITRYACPFEVNVAWCTWCAARLGPEDA